jgi:flagellar hook assembly protein FlgD
LTLPRAATVDVTVFDAAGRRVRTLLSGRAPAGRTSLAWDGGDARGRPAGAGLYFVRAAGPDGAATRRLVRID